MGLALDLDRGPSDQHSAAQGQSKLKTELRDLHCWCVQFNASSDLTLLPGSLLFTERGREFGAAVADASPEFLAKWHKNRTDGED